MLKKLKPVEQTSLPNRANVLDGLQIWMEASNGHRDVLSIRNSMIMAENIQENISTFPPETKPQSIPAKRMKLRADQSSGIESHPDMPNKCIYVGDANGPKMPRITIKPSEHTKNNLEPKTYLVDAQGDAQMNQEGSEASGHRACACLKITADTPKDIGAPRNKLKYPKGNIVCAKRIVESTCGEGLPSTTVCAH